jgi:hypothetical protein
MAVARAPLAAEPCPIEMELAAEAFAELPASNDVDPPESYDSIGLPEFIKLTEATSVIVPPVTAMLDAA